ncbi:MAG: amino acid racemase [Bacteroidetes bacterium]|nr:amino acid racemase [Bacteroidota bacterium]
MKNYKRIGIVGGVSPQSSALFYKKLVEKHYTKNNDYYYPEIVLFSVDFGKIKDFQQEENTHNYIQEFVNAIENLEKAGADFAVIASNTPHRVFSEIDKQVSIPLISMVDVIAEHSVKHNFKKVLLLGTKYTMSEDFYKKGLQAHGIEAIVPSYDEQIIVNNIIFDELVLDRIIQSSKQKLIKIIEKYPADAVILGCTELPLIIKKEDVHLTIIDTTDVFAEATLNFAIL